MWMSSKGVPMYNRWVKWVAAYVVLGYIVVMICYFGVWCRPFSRYWDMIPLDEAHSMITRLFLDLMTKS